MTQSQLATQSYGLYVDVSSQSSSGHKLQSFKAGAHEACKLHLRKPKEFANSLQAFLKHTVHTTLLDVIKCINFAVLNLNYVCSYEINASVTSSGYTIKPHYHALLDEQEFNKVFTLYI